MRLKWKEREKIRELSLTTCTIGTITNLMGCVGGNSVMAISLAALYATREFSAAAFLSLLVANSARYL